MVGAIIFGLMETNIMGIGYMGKKAEKANLNGLTVINIVEIG